LKDPKVQQTIRQTLMDRKDQLRRQAYYEMVRNEAKVENFLANSIVQGGVKK
jgi:peptidyl-prolyl cis-trans isomerase SurA